MPGAIPNLDLAMVTIPGETISDGDVRTIAHSTEGLTVDSEMATTLGLTTDIMQAGIMPVAAVDSPTTTGGGEMITDMRILPVVLPADLSIGMTCLREDGQV